MKYTPGPWVVRFNGTYFEVRPLENKKKGCKPGDYIADVCSVHFDEHPAMREHCPTKAEAEASANLIAAAPDLLEALKYAKRFLKPDDVDMTYIDDAIKKAEG